MAQISSIALSLSNGYNLWLQGANSLVTTATTQTFQTDFPTGEPRGIRDVDITTRLFLAVLIPRSTLITITAEELQDAVAPG